ncbi:site-specific DNA-methyltransferase [Candidatus Saccharibacteria bacterium]|nr:site-specific DNA-methyltransferase [Candidatus Saccharibacteria bacterium]
MSIIKQVKEFVQLDIPDDFLIALVFEMSRFADKSFTAEIKKLQKKYNVVIDTPTRKLLRKKFYYGSFYLSETPYNIPTYSYKEPEIEEAFADFYHRLKTYDPDKIISSMQKRIEDLKNSQASDSHMAEWLKQYDKRRANKLYSMTVIKLDQELFKSSRYNQSILTDFIVKIYDALENYRHLAIVVEGEIYDQQKHCITWELLYKAGIFAENFIQFKDKFGPFHKDQQIKNLTEFLKSRKVKNSASLAANFYDSISTGFKYEDCYISDNQYTKILIYKKIQLDQSHIPCPSCNTIIQSGNSYPEMFLRSWECKNPSCPDRSKSGRGKRFDEYGTYRYFKLVEKNENNLVSPTLYQNFHRDIFSAKNEWMGFLIKEYTFSKENIFLYNCTAKKLYHRKIVSPKLKKMTAPNNAVAGYDDLPIVKFYREVLKNKSFKTGKQKIKSDLEVINADSSEYLQSLAPGQIGTAITSPPYYNAREYSSWSTLIMYYVDMLINSRAVYNALAPNSYYLYNIGDIVSEDNIYVVSNMSKRRAQLGFLSAMVFEIAGFTLTGNIIWDKGEVQSKRNSTINLVSGYVKCVNCYEHILVFRKGPFAKLSNSVECITPVIKINSKGENTYKHTAPYPLDLVELIRPYLNQDLYVLDPFLGSGTTLKWCKINGFKGVGTELNETYYELCKKNLF